MVFKDGWRNGLCSGRECLIEGFREPVFEDANGTNSSGVTVLPLVNEIRWFRERKMPLKGQQHLLKGSLLIFFCFFLARKVDINTATTELSTQVTQDQQIVGTHKHMDRLARNG